MEPQLARVRVELARITTIGVVRCIPSDARAAARQNGTIARVIVSGVVVANDELAAARSEQ